MSGRIKILSGWEEGTAFTYINWWGLSGIYHQKWGGVAGQFGLEAEHRNYNKRQYNII